jgi:hypothetical protein
MENNKAFTLTNDGKNSFFFIATGGSWQVIIDKKKKRLIVNHLKIKAL